MNGPRREGPTLDPTIDALGRALAARIGAGPPEGAALDALGALIGARAEAAGIEGLSGYLARLRSGVLEELAALAGPLTNGWTWFFRDHAAIEALAERERRRARGRPSAVWVAGCATGEEAYATAIAFLERGLDVRVLGTDISAARIEVARRARYDRQSLRRVDDEALARHFERHPDGASVRGAVRACVELRVHNLLEAPPLAPDGGRWDAIVCRNVLLHLRPESAERARGVLRGCGADELLFGPTEHTPPAAERPTPARGMTARPSWPPRPGPSSAHRPDARSSSSSPTLPPPPSRPDTRLSPLAAIRPEVAAAGVSSADVRARLSAIVAAAPDDLGARLTLGSLALARGEPELARATYETAEALAPRSAEVQFLLGTLHRRQDAWREAAASLRRATFLDADLWPAWFLLAGTWDRLGEPARAERAIAETLAALERRPDPGWCSCVDEIDAVACPRDVVRAACLLRLERAAAQRDGG